MLFNDFIASVDDAKSLDRIHSIMKKHFCFKYNVQCMNDDEEYFRHLEHVNNNTYVAEDETAGLYTVFHRGEKVLSVNFNNGIIWAIA